MARLEHAKMAVSKYGGRARRDVRQILRTIQRRKEALQTRKFWIIALVDTNASNAARPDPNDDQPTIQPVVNRPEVN